ncbi:LOW QUALITY PROTEIN: hypothetical protein V2J09_009651 [Rumex salicifolius]
MVYGPPTPSRRRQFWEDLQQTTSNVTTPLFIGGDFNCILKLEERRGGCGTLSLDTNTFNDTAGIIDMGFTGPPFTWSRSDNANTKISKLLDRSFTLAQGSEHAPILLSLRYQRSINRDNHPFRFEAAWMEHLDSMRLIAEWWETSVETSEALNSIKQNLLSGTALNWQHSLSEEEASGQN